jgi:hypothetical protein
VDDFPVVERTTALPTAGHTDAPAQLCFIICYPSDVGPPSTPSSSAWAHANHLNRSRSFSCCLSPLAECPCLQLYGIIRAQGGQRPSWGGDGRNCSLLQRATLTFDLRARGLVGVDQTIEPGHLPGSGVDEAQKCVRRNRHLFAPATHLPRSLTAALLGLTSAAFACAMNALRLTHR